MAVSWTPDDLGAALATLGTYTDAEIEAAIRNYSTILADKDAEPFPRYVTFAGFLRTGPDNYGDQAKPFERCK